MKENEEDINSSDNSAVSENAEFSTLLLSNNNNSEPKDILESKNINIKKEDNTVYTSMFSFSVVSKNGNNDNINQKHQENSNENNSEFCEIRTSDLPNNNKPSLWEKIMQQIKNFKNQIIFNYNIFSGLNNLKLNDTGLPKEIQIFDEKYSKQDDKLINILKNIPWFSYRKDFSEIKEKDQNYTSDAGWGCMLRASQMILAQGLYKLKSIENLESFIVEYLAYFYDNKIPVKLLCKSKDDNKNNKENNLKSKKEENNSKDEEIYEDFIVIDNAKVIRMSFIDIPTEMIKGLENMSNRNSNLNFLTPPFSIRNYMKIYKKIHKNGKKVGDWFSNYDVINIITTINDQLNKDKDNDFKIFNFEDGGVFIEDIINECFKEEEKVSEFNGFEKISFSAFENSEVLFNEQIINKKYDNKIYVFNKRRFEFNKKFIIFISVRHGLYSLDDKVYNDVLNVFDIKGNIGIIGGRNGRAFYFIGKCDTNLLFLDPHYIQPTLQMKDFGTISVQESYRPNDIYYMNIKELSPSFTIGFAIKDMETFKKFMEKMNTPDYFEPQGKYKNENNKAKKFNLFVVKNWHYPVKDDDDSNQDISNHVEIQNDFL